MEIDEYQRRSATTSIYRDSVSIAVEDRTVDEWIKLGSLFYVSLKMNGEAGEFAEQVGKALRDDYGIITPDRKVALEKELGDVLWYVAQAASELGLDLDMVAYKNLRKLQDRQERNVLGGSGDER